MTAASAPPVLVHEFDMRIDVRPDDVGRGPQGHRIITTVTAGKVTGARLSGDVAGAGADWLLLGPDGFGRADVRLTVRTDDGALVYIQYGGLVELNAAVVRAMRGGTEPTRFGEQYFFITPRMETGDERYAWVNRTVFVGDGRLIPGPGVEYRVYRLANTENGEQRS